MKKLLPYILILIIVLVGLFNPIIKIHAISDFDQCVADATKYGDNITQCYGKSGDPSLTTSKNYNLLAPLPCENGTPGCENNKLTTYDPTQNNNIGGYLNIIIKLFIGICAVLAVIMIVVGGIEYMTTELISSKEAGKERIRNAILGLLLALGAWTLLYTINPNLLNTDLKSLTAVEVEVALNDNVPQTPVNGKYKDGTVFGASWDDTAGKTAILPAGVTVNAGECTTVGQTSCTSTRGLDLSYINTIKANCTDCTNLVITAGTESWLHGGSTGNTSHGPGSPTVDLRPTPELANYITNGKTPVNMTRYSKDGISYLYEGNHWHVGK